MNKPKTKKLLFLFRHAPYGSALAKEGIDAVLAASAYDQDLSVLFMDDGVFQLLKHQKPDDIEEKNIINILSAFTLYDIQSLFVCQESLAERGLRNTDIAIGINIVAHNTVSQLLSQQDHILSF
ncbi:sulfurtransferase TusC [Candidatus Endobugula sertula]|uniref:Sulfurtransferase TusC n=1 Tax=Candidatus Endobugula sertula TaxID=62101 RepID=A0A1D2QT30_9GAMM|nr:sulfurtransferase TusC [Candidatus Endobugula sertula]